MQNEPIALIIDIVRSRELKDRAAAQAAVLQTFGAATAERSIRQALWPTVGDEFQAVFADITQALRATAIVRLTLPIEVDCRFGFGQGEIQEIEQAATGSIQDGSAWWRARAAIEEAHRREDKSNPYLRGWFVSGRASGGADSIVNSFLLMRDKVITDMRPRERRLTAGVLLGRAQSALAAMEGITQSAVSQNLRKSGGAALLAAHMLFEAPSDSRVQAGGGPR
ncbi:MAG: hypothetical protein EPN48_14080 [Microbacteriaceae bacterium]|nr:MAG: hypothetical protein EPN48_14080 [Microbacteriaceae bacterium]